MIAAETEKQTSLGFHKTRMWHKLAEDLRKKHDLGAFLASEGFDIYREINVEPNPIYHGMLEF